MSALLLISQKGADKRLSLFQDRPSAVDNGVSQSLLAATCAEQQARLHTLLLLSDYLAMGCCAGRRRQLVCAERRALLDGYEDLWGELEGILSQQWVKSARASVESTVSLARCHKIDNSAASSMGWHIEPAGEQAVRLVQQRIV